MFDLILVFSYKWLIIRNFTWVSHGWSYNMFTDYYVPHWSYDEYSFMFHPKLLVEYSFVLHPKLLMATILQNSQGRLSFSWCMYQTDKVLSPFIILCMYQTDNHKGFLSCVCRQISLLQTEGHADGDNYHLSTWGTGPNAPLASALGMEHHCPIISKIRSHRGRLEREIQVFLHSE